MIEIQQQQQQRQHQQKETRRDSLAFQLVCLASTKGRNEFVDFFEQTRLALFHKPDDFHRLETLNQVLQSVQLAPDFVSLAALFSGRWSDNLSKLTPIAIC